MVRHREAYKTWGDVFDQATDRALQHLISGGYMDGLHSPIKVGKEANVFLALKGEETVVVKIYRTSTCDFNRMYEYMKGDPRFGGLVKKRRKVVFQWAQREYRNLLIAHKAGIRCPVPHAARDNILVMDLIGDESVAQQLISQPPKNPKKFYEDVVRQMKLLHNVRLVHADLSPYNILNDNEKAVFIDMSQATTYDNPNWERFFERDIKNVAAHFKRIGVDTDAEHLRKAILK